ncbi:MAG: hypothetical protein AABX88_03295 [Nanoarchaeota archaeon]
MVDINNLFMNYEDFLKGAKSCPTLAITEREIQIEELMKTYNRAYLICLGYSAEEISRVERGIY